MKKFWPHRSEAEGFSIQNLASKCRLKISSLRFPQSEISNQILDENNKIFLKEEGKLMTISNLSTKNIHWANRDFSEYKRAS